MPMIKKLLPYMKKYRRSAILSPIMMILEVVADVMIPLYMASIVDVGIRNQDVAFVVRTGIFMILFAIFGMAMGTISSFFAANAGFGFGSEIRKDAFSKIQDFTFANLDQLPAPTLITRLTTDTDLLSQVAMMSLRMAIRAPFMMIFALIMAFQINAKLSLVFLVAIPVTIAVLYIVLRWAMPRFAIIQEKVDAVNARVQDTLTGIRVVKAFNRQDHEEDRFRRRNTDLRDTILGVFSILMLLMPVLNLVIYGCISAVLWFGGQQIMAGEMAAGQLIAFITYITQIMMAVMMLSMFIMMTTRASASAKRILEVVETKPEIVSPKAGIKEVADGSIRFNNVSFHYPGFEKDVLTDIDLDIPSGHLVGIIGSTGSSKTTLVQLIPRLYEATKGQVLVGGRDVKDYDLSSLREQIGMVLQKNTLVSGTVRSNMQWGKADATDEEIIQALKQAQAWDFISKTDLVLDTPVDQGGSNFSGGQKQRLTIARALMKRPKIMILDDSTSAVDTATDARIRRSFRENLADVTTLIIAQRISSISDADLILVMEHGRIVDRGSHEELMETSAIYREIYESQEGGLSD